MEALGPRAAMVFPVRGGAGGGGSAPQQQPPRVEPAERCSTRGARGQHARGQTPHALAARLVAVSDHGVGAVLLQGVEGVVEAVRALLGGQGHHAAARVHLHGSGVTWRGTRLAWRPENAPEARTHGGSRPILRCLPIVRPKMFREHGTAHMPSGWKRLQECVRFFCLLGGGGQGGRDGTCSVNRWVCGAAPTCASM